MPGPQASIDASHAAEIFWKPSKTSCLQVALGARHAMPRERAEGRGGPRPQPMRQACSSRLIFFSFTQAVSGGLGARSHKSDKSGRRNQTLKKSRQWRYMLSLSTARGKGAHVSPAVVFSANNNPHVAMLKDTAHTGPEIVYVVKHHQDLHVCVFSGRMQFWT